LVKSTFQQICFQASVSTYRLIQLRHEKAQTYYLRTVEGSSAIPLVRSSPHGFAIAAATN